MSTQEVIQQAKQQRNPVEWIKSFFQQEFTQHEKHCHGCFTYGIGRCVGGKILVDAMAEALEYFGE